MKNDEIPIKRLSSVISIGDFVIKTCFNPNKIIVIEEQNEKLTPQDDYFKEIKNNLENIEYCYSTPITNPYRNSEYVVVTYWTESNQVDGKTEYKHKYILFYPTTKKFSKIDELKTNGESFFAQSCTNLRNKYIYCNIDNSFPLFRIHHFSIIPAFLNADEIQMSIKLVNVYYIFSNKNYYRPIGIYKYLYSKSGKYAYFFLTEMHDKQNNKTNLMTSYYYNWDLQSFINQNIDEETYNGINIEDIYIDPNLFNYILPNTEELIIIYIMKGAQGKNLLLLNTYNYTTDLTKKTKFDKYSSSNYIRDDICENPKYMQSMYVNSFIKYNERDQEYIRNNPDKKFYTYQKDIATVISCDDGNNKVSYQVKKIQLPQCLNILNEINGVKTPFTFTKDNYKSLRNVQIEFFDSKLYKNYVILRVIKNGEPKVVLNADILDLSGDEILEFTKMPFFRAGKKIQFPYRIIKTEERDNSISCHLSSDICYLEFYFQGENQGDPECPWCNIIGDNTCLLCDDITAINKIDNECGCGCDEKEGFNKEPDIDIDMCICKKGYSFYKDIYHCLPDTVLKYGPYCILRKDEKSLIKIYIDLINGKSICYENGLPMCCPDPNSDNSFCQSKEWFKLGDYIFNSYKIGKCVYITFNNSIVMYSKKSDCVHIDINLFNECSGIHIKNEIDYLTALDNAYEYNLEDNNSSLIIQKNNTNKKNSTTFYLLNNFTKGKSTVTLSQGCIEKIKEEKNLQNLLIFIAAIKKEGSISTQVEYSFYNPTPEFINEKLNVSDICSNPKNPGYDLNKRKLEVSQEWINNDNYTIGIDEVIINVEVNLTSYMKNIEELSKQNINIFDSDDPFYNDVCFKYKYKNTSDKYFDMYLQERRDYYFIKDGLCESDCKQVGFDNNTKRIMCKCNIKPSTEKYENITFEPNKGFEEDYLLPNIKVLKCFDKLQFSLGFLISFILLICFIILSFINCTCIIRKENRRYYSWEKPIEELKDVLEKNENEYKKKNNISNDNGSGGNQGGVNPDKDPEVELFRQQPLNKSKNDIQKKERSIKNGQKGSDQNVQKDKEKLPLIDPSETSSQKVDHSYSKDSNNTSFTQDSKKENNNKSETIHKKKTKSKSKKKGPKPNPPSKEKSSDPPGSKVPFNKRKINVGGEVNGERKCVPTNYRDLIYTAIKYPKGIHFIFRWIAKMVSDNTVLFSLFCSEYDKNGFFIKCSVLIIAISFYITVIIAFQFNTSTLHLFLSPDEEFGAYIPGWFLNVLPNLFAYLLIHFFKDSLSLREFYWEEKERIDFINFKLESGKDVFNEWEVKKKIEITRIKKFRNNLANNIRLTIIFGLIILSIDCYYISVFFSVYDNSFWCIVVNILMSILVHIGFFAIVHLISSCCNCPLAKCLLNLSEVCCGWFYLIFLSFKLCNEEYQKNEEQDELAIEIAEEDHEIINEQNRQSQRSRNRNTTTENQDNQGNQDDQIITNQVYTYDDLKK